eukprot:scaffold1224_cov136-Amphora_coffeaeformis.AAC.3
MHQSRLTQAKASPVASKAATIGSARSCIVGGSSGEIEATGLGGCVGEKAWGKAADSAATAALWPVFPW